MKILPLAVLLAASVAAGGAQAHHSGSMWEPTKTVDLKGTVRAFQWTNPHSWLQVVVEKPGGGTEEWSIEMASPNVLGHKGWKPSTVKPGDKVEVVVHPLIAGGPSGSYVSAILPDGTVMNTGSGSGAGSPPPPRPAG